MAFAAYKREAPVLTLGLILDFPLPQSPMHSTTAFWGCHQLSPWIHLDPLEPGAVTPKGARWGMWLKFKCMSICQSHHKSGPAWGGKPRGPFRGAFLRPKKKLLRPHPSHLQFQTRKFGAWGVGETY